MTPRDHIVPDDPVELLENYQSAMHHYHRARRKQWGHGTQVFGREVRRFEAAIGAVYAEANPDA